MNDMLDYTATPAEGLQFDVTDADSSPYSASRCRSYRYGVEWTGGKARYSLSVPTHSSQTAATAAGYAMLSVSVGENGIFLKTFTERTYVPVGNRLQHTYHVDFIHQPKSSGGVRLTIVMAAGATFPGACVVDNLAASLTIQPIE